MPIRREGGRERRRMAGEGGVDILGMAESIGCGCGDGVLDGH